LAFSPCRAPERDAARWPPICYLLLCAGVSYNWDMSTRELIDQELDVLPEALQREVYDFARFLRLKSDGESFDGLMASEAVLARDWDTPDEDAAWAGL